MILSTWDLTAIPWQEGGRSRLGADCLGIVLLALEQLQVRMVDPWLQIAARWQDGWRSLREIRPEGWMELPPDTPPQGGDILVSGKDGIPDHVSIAVDDGLHLTSTRPHGSTVRPFREVRPRLLWIWRRP